MAQHSYIRPFSKHLKHFTPTSHRFTGVREALRRFPKKTGGAFAPIALALFTGSQGAIAAPVTVDFIGDGPPLPYFEDGFVVSSVFPNSALVTGGLAAELFSEDRSIVFQPLADRVFTLVELTLFRGDSIDNRFSLEGFLDGASIWEMGPYNFSDGLGTELVSGFDSPEFDEFRINGFGDGTDNNIIFFDSLTFDVISSDQVAPIPLPLPFAMLTSALVGLSLMRASRFGRGTRHLGGA